MKAQVVLHGNLSNVQQEAYGQCYIMWLQMFDEAMSPPVLTTALTLAHHNRNHILLTSE